MTTSRPSPASEAAETSAAAPRFDTGRIALGVVIVVAVPVLLTFGRDQWFYLDEWDFLAGRSAGSIDDVLRSHNEHWTSVPVVVYRVMWSVFGLRSYLPYQLLSIGVHLLVAVLLWKVVRRQLVGSWVATLIVTPFVFFGAGYQNIFWGFQITFTGAVAAGLAQLLFADHAGRQLGRRDGFGLACGLVGLMCSGIAVPMTVMVGVAVLVRRGLRAAAAQTVPLAGVYLLWWSFYGRDEYDTDWPGLGSVLRFGSRLLSSGVADITRVSFAGLIAVALVVAGLVLWSWAHRGDWRGRAGSAVGAGAALIVLAAITGVGRSEFSVVFAEASRYSYIVAALAVPIVGLAVAGLSEWRRHAGLIIVALMWLGLPANVAALADHSDERMDQLGRKDLVLALHPVATASTPDDARPLWGEGFELTMGWLRQRANDGTLPEPDDISDATAAEAAFRLAVYPVDEPPGPTCVPLDEPVVVDVVAGQRLGIEGGVILLQDVQDGAVARRFGFLLPDQGGVLVVRDGPRQLRLSGLQDGRPSALCDAPEVAD